MYVREFLVLWGAYAPKNFLMSNVVFRTSSFSLSVIFVIFFLLVLRAFILVANFLSGGVCDDDFSQVDINLVLVVFFCWVESSLPLVPWFKSRISRQIHKRTLKGVKRHVKYWTLSQLHNCPKWNRGTMGDQIGPRPVTQDHGGPYRTILEPWKTMKYREV